MSRLYKLYENAWLVIKVNSLKKLKTIVGFLVHKLALDWGKVGDYNILTKASMILPFKKEITKV